MTLTKEQAQALRGLPLDTVREALLKEGIRLSSTPPRKARKGLDVAIYEAGIPYAEACPLLARLFPDVVGTEMGAGMASISAALDEARRWAAERGLGFREYTRNEKGWWTRVEIIKWWRALQLAGVDIHVRPGKGGKGRSIPDGHSGQERERGSGPHLLRAPVAAGAGGNNAERRA